MTPFERGLIAHLAADWLLQNDWIAQHKDRITHPAAWLHAAIHGVLLAWALGWPAALLLALVHLLIDTRLPLRWWQRVFAQTTNGEVALHVRIWVDQTLHLVSLALAVWLLEAYL